MKSGLTRRQILRSVAAVGVLRAGARTSLAQDAFGGFDEGEKVAEHLPVTLKQVPFPKNITFTVHYPGKPAVTLSGHYWYNAAALRA